MGLIIVIVVGAVLGWLAVIVVNRDDRVGTAICVAAGLAGALAAAAIAGDVPLAKGLSPTQLLWSAVGAILAIVTANVLSGSMFGHRPHVQAGNV